MIMNYSQISGYFLSESDHSPQKSSVHVERNINLSGTILLQLFPIIITCYQLITLGLGAWLKMKFSIKYCHIYESFIERIRVVLEPPS